jgi:7-cyano-7-deazaguanine synthase
MDAVSQTSYSESTAAQVAVGSPAVGSPERRAVCLLSGGLDSTTCLAAAMAEGYSCYALSFDYGQRHRMELEAAARIASAMGAKQHVTLNLDLRAFGGSALTADIDVPKHDSADEIGAGIPITYVPARNTIFLSCALGWAEVLGAFDLFLGVNAIDYSGYPDCRPDFIRSFEQTATLATAAGVEGRGRFRIHTPLISLSKADIVRLGAQLGVDFSLTHSCYDPLPDGRPCGRCDSCLLRRRGFAEAGIVDPLHYAA